MTNIEIRNNSVTATVSARLVEDDDDCLAAAAAMVADEIGADCNLTGRWDDEETREAIIVTGWTDAEDTAA